MTFETDSSEFFDFLHHPNSLASGRVHTFLTERGSESLTKLIRDLTVLYELRTDIDVLIALCSNSIVTEYLPLLLDFGQTSSEVCEAVFDLYVEHDPLRWLAQIAAGRNIAEVFQMVIRGLNAYSDCTKEILRYVVEFTCDDHLTNAAKAVRAVITQTLA
jgi:hypothetical protein